ncbi:MAG: SGNH/GDSL hydrolase family protein [Spirochaetota bacterium]
MLERSLLSTGNNCRTKRLLEKAANGEEVTIAFIGGSITEGYGTSSEGSYAYGSYELFRKHYAVNSDAVHIVNAGMCGTPSTIGMIRYERDVSSMAQTKPDIVFVEFAVNDGDDPTDGASYESLVRTILTEDHAPAVVLVFSVFKNGWNLENRLIPIGEAYDLPMISIREAVKPALDEGHITEDEFFRDEYHPTEYGFQIMSGCIFNYFETVRAEETAGSDLTLPDTAVIGTQFTNIRMIDSSGVTEDVSVTPGSFTQTDGAMRSYNYDISRRIFPDNWHKHGTENHPFILRLHCKNLILIHKRSAYATFGSAGITVDGKEPVTVDAHFSDAWNNPWCTVLIDEQTAADHMVSIRMRDDDADKYFTIFGFGYCQ